MKELSWSVLDLNTDDVSIVSVVVLLVNRVS